MAKKSKSNELIPPKGDKDVAKAVFDILDEILSDKESLGLESKWYRFYELGKNKHWRKEIAGLTLNSANLLSVHRRRTVNTLTDNNPTFNVRRIVARDDTEDQFKQVLRATEYWWGETEQQDILELSVFNGETYGVCIEKSVFDLDKEYGIGEVDTVVVDPYYFGIYPVKCLDIQKAEAVVHYYPMSVRAIKRKYGKAAAEVVADHEVHMSLSDSRRTVSGIKNTIRGSNNSSGTTLGGVFRKLANSVIGASNVTSDEAVVVECWVKDYSVDSEGIPLYDGYIRVITAVNGTIVLDDRNNPSINPNLSPKLTSNTYLFDKFPFIKANSNKDPVNFWGEGDFEQLAGMQMEFNKALSQFSTLKDKVAGVKFVNPANSGVHNDKIMSGATVLNPTNTNHGMGYLEPPPIPRELLESVNMFKELLFSVAGTFELENANTPGKSVIAYKAIAALLEHASTMMRGKIRNYSKLIRDRGRMAVSQMQNWYTEERFITYQESGDEITGTVIGTEMIVPMKLSVVSGSTMPRSEVQRREEAMELFTSGAIDAEELLKALDWDKADEVVNRMAEGPVNAFIEKLIMAGMPEEMAQYFGEVAAIDEKKLERKIERAEMATFDQVFQFEGMQPDIMTEMKVAKSRAEIDESKARASKIEAEREETFARTEKERASIRQTDDRIKIDRAKVVGENRVKNKQVNLKKVEGGKTGESSA